MEDDKSKEQTPRDLRKEQRLEDFLQSQIDTSKKFSKAMESMVGSRKRKGKDGKMGEFPSVLDETRKKFMSLNRRLDTLLPRITRMSKSLGKNITNSNNIIKVSNKVDKESVKVKNMSVKSDKKILKIKEQTAKRIVKSISHDNSKIPSAPKGYVNPTIFPWETRSIEKRIMKEDIVENMRWKVEERKLREQEIDDRKKRNQELLASKKKLDDEKKKQFEDEFKALLKEEEDRKKSQDEADKIRFKQPDDYHLKMLGIQKGYKASASDFFTATQVGQARDEKNKAAQLAIMMAAMSSSARRKASVFGPNPMFGPPTAKSSMFGPHPMFGPPNKPTSNQQPVDLLTQMRDFLKSIMNDMNFTVSRDRRENIRNRFTSAGQVMKMTKRSSVKGRTSRLSDRLFSTSFNGIPLGNPLSFLTGSGLGSTGLGAGLMALAFGGDKKQKGLMTQNMHRKARMKSLGKTVLGGGAKLGGGILKGFAGRGLLGLLTKVPIIGPFLSMGLAGAALGTGMYSSLKEGGGVYEGLKRGGSMALSLATGGLLSPEDIRSGASNVQDIIEEKLLKDYAGASFEGKTINAVASVLMDITSGMFSILGWKDIAEKFKKGAENIKSFGLRQAIFGKDKDYKSMSDDQLQQAFIGGDKKKALINELKARNLGKDIKVERGHGRSKRKMNEFILNSGAKPRTLLDDITDFFGYGSDKIGTPYSNITLQDKYNMVKSYMNGTTTDNQRFLLRDLGLADDIGLTKKGEKLLTTQQMSRLDAATNDHAQVIASASNITNGGSSTVNNNTVNNTWAQKDSHTITGMAIYGNNFA